MKNVIILCCFRLFTTTNRNKDSKNCKRIQTHRRPFCTPKPDADPCMRVNLPLDRKTVENEDRATGPPGPPGRRAVAGRGPLAAGPSGRRAAGPLGRGGPWAAGLLLAKPDIIVAVLFV